MGTLRGIFARGLSLSGGIPIWPAHQVGNRSLGWFPNQTKTVIEDHLAWGCPEKKKGWSKTAIPWGVVLHLMRS